MAIPPLIIEDELLRCLKRGDQKAFEAIYRKYINVIYRKLIYLVKSPDIADELAQDVFLRIWEKRETIDTEKSFRAFIYCIAQNLVTDFYRRLALDRKLQDHLIYSITELEHPIDNYYDAEANRRILSEAMDLLPAQRKKVMALVKLEGRSYEEVSSMLGISTSTIRDHIVKGTKTLKAYFAENEVALFIVSAAFISDSFGC